VGARRGLMGAALNGAVAGSAFVLTGGSASAAPINGQQSVYAGHDAYVSTHPRGRQLRRRRQAGRRPDRRRNRHVVPEVRRADARDRLLVGRGAAAPAHQQPPTTTPPTSVPPTTPPAPGGACVTGALLVPSCGVLWGAAAGGFTPTSRDQALKSWEAATGRTATIYHTYHKGDEKFPTAAEIAMTPDPANWPRDDRRERPDDWHEAGQHDGPGPVPLEEALRLRQVLLFEQPRVRPPEQRRPESPAEQIPGLVAGDPRDRHQ
jgi:hypothetical protein